MMLPVGFAPSPSDPWGPRLVDSPTRLVFETMGTVASLSAPGEMDARLRDRVQQVFADLDAHLSPFRPDSEVSRVNAGRLVARRAGQQFRRALDLAHTWYLETAGAFTPYPPGGGLDLNGVVKAMAIADAGDLLVAGGVSDWCLNVGGDVLVHGFDQQPAPGEPWTAGIVHPADPGSLLSVYRFTDVVTPAIATSGVTERGEHVWRTDRRAAQDQFIQVSVVAGDIITADVLATALLAGGQDLLVEALRRWPIEVLAVTRAGRNLASRAFWTPDAAALSVPEDASSPSGAVASPSPAVP